jgi:hypothetical protein
MAMIATKIRHREAVGCANLTLPLTAIGSMKGGLGTKLMERDFLEERRSQLMSDKILPVDQEWARQVRAIYSQNELLSLLMESDGRTLAKRVTALPIAISAATQGGLSSVTVKRLLDWGERSRPAYCDFFQSRFPKNVSLCYSV